MPQVINTPPPPPEIENVSLSEWPNYPYVRVYHVLCQDAPCQIDTILFIDM